ncbi:MAG TPA: metallophosphoesterase [Terriglobia bacterium]|nr:metallophosphoesterase [Terriglobia bacterium]
MSNRLSATCLIHLFLWLGPQPGFGQKDLGPIVTNGQRLSVAVLGDFGYPGKGGKPCGEHPDQRRVADAMFRYHTERMKFAFGLTLGDNFYPKGVKDIKDPHWKCSWEDFYTRLEIPFYATLGNHDYRQNADAQLEYSKGSKSFRMPAKYYTFAAGPVRFFALDTDEGTLGFWSKKPWSDSQRNWLVEQLEKYRNTKWKVVYGHHPIYSYGYHGNEERLVRKLLPELKKYGVDVYLSGHEHDLQHLHQDGIHFFIGGSGGKDLRETKKGPQSLFADSKHSFLVLSGENNTLRVTFLGTGLEQLHEQVLTK